MFWWSDDSLIFAFEISWHFSVSIFRLFYFSIFRHFGYLAFRLFIFHSRIRCRYECGNLTLPDGAIDTRLVRCSGPEILAWCMTMMKPMLSYLMVSHIYRFVWSCLYIMVRWWPSENFILRSHRMPVPFHYFVCIFWYSSRGFVFNFSSFPAILFRPFEWKFHFRIAQNEAPKSSIHGDLIRHCGYDNFKQIKINQHARRPTWKLQYLKAAIPE